jgi:hypothetical protein
LACVTMLASFLIYDAISGPFTQTLKDYGAGVKKQVMKVDDEILADMIESVKSNQKLVDLEKDVTSLHALSDDLAVAQADILNHMNQHKYREAISKKLDSLVAIEEAAVMSIRTRMVKKVKDDVLKAFNTDKKPKESALAQAIAVLAAGPNSKLGKDVVGEEFSIAFKNYKIEYAKQAKGSDEILVQLEKDLAAVATAPVFEIDHTVIADSFLLGNTIKA